MMSYKAKNPPLSAAMMEQLRLCSVNVAPVCLSAQYGPGGGVSLSDVAISFPSSSSSALQNVVVAAPAPPTGLAAYPSSVDTRFQCRAVTRDEEETCVALARSHDSVRVVLMPTHHIDPMGNLVGFRFSCHAHAPAAVLPVCRTMFHGHTIVECHASEAEVLAFMSRGQEELKRTMAEFLRGVAAALVGPGGSSNAADKRCEPDPSAHSGMDSSGIYGVDQSVWSPEVPARIGFYHAFVRGFNRDVRAHKLYILCSGGLNKASDEFCNLVIDTSSVSTASEVAGSHQAWWLRRACHRSRCRLAQSLAEAFGVRVSSIQDIYAHKPVFMAAHAVDTLEHDITMSEDGLKVAVFNGCADTSRIDLNGVVCNMHPSEGAWIFRGSSMSGSFGGMFGDTSACGAFPTSAPAVQEQFSVVVSDGPAVVRLSGPAKSQTPYMCFDERVLKTLESMNWRRDNGSVEFIPVVVGMP